MNTYKIVWEISELDAKTPLAAAQIAQNWITENAASQYYVQDQKTLELFSVDLQEEDEDAVLPVSEYIPEIPAKINKKKTYYLLGEAAVGLYENEGIEALIEASQNNSGTGFGLFCFIEGETSSIELMEYANGWYDYTCITEEEYQKLSKL